MTTQKVMKKEKDNLPVEFEYKESVYTAPPGKLWPLEALEAQEDQKMLEFIRQLFGEDQYRQFRKDAKTMEDLNDFLEVMFNAMDLDRGK